MTTSKAFVRRTTGLTAQIVFVRLLSIVYASLIVLLVTRPQRNEAAALLMFLSLVSAASLLSLPSFLSAVVPRSIAEGRKGVVRGDYAMVNTITLAGTVSVVVAALLLSPLILGFFQLELRPDILPMFAFVAFTLIPYNLLITATQMLLGLNRVRQLATLNLVNAVTTYLLALVLVSPAFRLGSWGIVISWFVASVFALALGGYYLRDIAKLPSGDRHSVGELMRFSSPLWFASIFITVNGFADQIFVLRYLNSLYPDILGTYYYAVNIVQIVITVLGAAAVVLLPTISEAKGISDGRMQAVFAGTTKFAVYICAIVVVGLIVFANTILLALLGEEFIPCTSAFQILSVTVFSTTMSGLLAPVFSAIKKTLVPLLSALVHFVVAVSVAILLVPRFAPLSPGVGMATAALANLAGYLANLAVFYFFLRHDTKLRIPSAILPKAILACVLVGIVMWPLSVLAYAPLWALSDATVGQLIQTYFPALVGYEYRILSIMVAILLLPIYLLGILLYVVLLIALRGIDQQDFDLLRRAVPNRFTKIVSFVEALYRLLTRSSQST
jgi:O-antigen/teichoic acid export membrane protein